MAEASQRPERPIIQGRKRNGDGGRLTIALPALSWNVIRLEKA